MIVPASLKPNVIELPSVNHFAKLACQGNPDGSTIRFDRSCWQSQHRRQSPSDWCSDLHHGSRQRRDESGRRKSGKRKEWTVCLCQILRITAHYHSLLLSYNFYIKKTDVKLKWSNICFSINLLIYSAEITSYQYLL